MYMYTFIPTRTPHYGMHNVSLVTYFPPAKEILEFILFKYFLCNFLGICLKLILEYNIKVYLHILLREKRCLKNLENCHTNDAQKTIQIKLLKNVFEGWGNVAYVPRTIIL